MSNNTSHGPDFPAADRRMRFALYATLAIFSVLINAPWQFTMPQGGVDPSWMLVLSRAAVNNAQWGRDVVFTYGPYLDLVTRLLVPEHAVASIISRFLLLAISMILIFSIVRERNILYVCTVLAAASVSFACVQDTQFFLYPFLFSIIYFQPERRHSVVILGSLAALGGLAVLIKLSYGLLYLFVLLAADVDRLRQRKIPMFLACFFLSFAAFYCAAGQKIASLVPYLMNSGEIIVGYGDAMAREGNLYSQLFQGLFLTYASACFACVAYLAFSDARSRPRSRSLLFLSTFLALSFISYKAGFSREDLWHIPTALTCIGLALLLYLASIGDQSAELPMRGTIVFFVSLVVIGAAIVLSPNGRKEGLITRPLQAAGQAVRLVKNPAKWFEQLTVDYQASLVSIGLQQPLPHLDGSVDTIPSIQAAVIANGLDYRNRPVIQEYSDYTERLIKLNQAFFQGERAPDFLIASPGSIDNRWPASAEGPLWPILFARYRASELWGNLLILQRHKEFHAAPCDGINTVAARLDRPIQVPQNEEAVFLRIVLGKTLLGQFMSLLFQPEPLFISAKLADGQTVVHRLIPEIARQGMILSPYVDTSAGLAALASGNAQMLNRRKVTEFTVGSNHGRSVQYGSDIAVSFCQLVLPSQENSAFVSSIESQLKLETSSPTAQR